MAYKNCRICGEKIPKDTTWRRKYCSEECMLEAGRIMNLKKYHENIFIKYKDLKIKKKCEVCGIDFYKSQPNQIICSKICRMNKRQQIKDFSWFEDKERKTRGKLLNYSKLRFEIFKRDNFTCQYCGMNVKDDKIKLHLDHIIPKSKGGKTITSNLQASCVQCNLGKRDIKLNEKELLNELH